MNGVQRGLFDDRVPHDGMPTTRYQGSKRKLLPWLHEVLGSLDFSTCIDLFGGTGSVTHLLRSMGKKTIYNDILFANAMIARALFAPGEVVLEEDEVVGVLTPTPGCTYSDHIATVYDGMYFTSEENRELDCACQNIPRIADPIGRAEAYYCLFQACLAKRPYNLFHRANLEMRLRDVKRSFGNKTTWDKPFDAHLRKFHRELRAYRSNPSGYPVEVLNQSAFEVRVPVDLAYIDTPYAKSKGVQETNYFNFYHFLDACITYEDIPSRALPDYAHRPIYPPARTWHPCDSVESAFESLFRGVNASTIVVSYRADGIPGPPVIADLLGRYYERVRTFESSGYKYALTSRGLDNRETAIVAAKRRPGA